MAETGKAARVCVGAITGAHGVRGLVKVKPFTQDPAAIGAYGAVTDEAGGRRFGLELLSLAKGQWLARIEGVADRNAAEALRGTRLYVAREALPEPEEDEFYYADLIGLRVELPDGAPFGRVRAVHDFGAGDVVEIAGADGGAIHVPFTRAAVPVIDVPGGRIVVDPPAGLLEPPGHRPEEEGEP
ncbi:MAG TPA: ribosome maturation factor RimM [Alphaproteobacteria bacterium]|nr:ribosome maturation factor RimM [Alphaproteobacteria bacterium]